MSVTGYAVRVMASLLDGSDTHLADDSAEQTGDVLEAHGGLPMKIPGSTTDLNIKLGTITQPKFLKVAGDQGVSFKIAEGGTAISANPWAFLADLDDGMQISEVWITNSEPDEKEVTILAVE